MRIKIVLLYSIFILVGSALFFMLNYFFLDRYFIPDPCIYHFRISKPSFLFRLFYTLERGGENGHPFPTTFNFMVTLGFGAFSGYKFASYLKNKIFKI